MKKFLSISIILLLATSGFAQTSTDARNILDKAFSVYENSKGIQLSFTAVMTEANGTAYEPQKGVAKVKGNKFVLDMPGLKTWFDGKTQWVLMTDLNEVNISNPTNDEIASISPLALLSMYKTGYSLNNPVAKTVNGKSASVIEMTPSGNKSEFKNISVAIDKKTNTVLQVSLTMKNGVNNKIDIDNYNANYNFPDTDFVFDKSKYSKVEVVDLR